MCLCFGVAETGIVVAIAWILKIVFNISLWVTKASDGGRKHYWRPKRISLKSRPPVYRWFRWNFGFRKIKKANRQPNYTVEK
jgi:hypothetical protein